MGKVSLDLKLETEKKQTRPEIMVTRSSTEMACSISLTVMDNNIVDYGWFIENGDIILYQK